MQVPPDVAETLVSFEFALAGAVLAVCAAACAPITIMLARRLFPGRRVFFARWGFSHVLLAALLYFSLSQLVYAGAVQLFGREPRMSVLLGAAALAQSLVCVVVFYWAGKRDPQGIRSLGFWRGKQLRALGVGLLVWALSWPGIMGLSWLWPWLVTRLGRPFEAQPYQAGLLELTGMELWFAIALAVFVIPFFEEVLFRGFLQPLFVQNFRDKGGVVITAALFAAMHGSSAFLPIFGLSLVLGGVMLRTQRLIAVWGIHVANNGLPIALLLLNPEAGEVLAPGICTTLGIAL